MHSSMPPVHQAVPFIRELKDRPSGVEEVGLLLKE